MIATEDLFTTIHKGLRSMIYDLSRRLQTHDFADIAATESLAKDLEYDFAVAQSAGCILCIFNRHASDEETAIFADAAKAGSDLVAELIEEHHDLARREAEIARSAHALMALEKPEGRVEAGEQLNRSANDLFAAYLTHMNREENHLVPWMRENFSDAQMIAMRGAVMGHMPPDRLFAIVGWMVPSLNVRELSGLLGALRRSMPPPAFRAITDICGARVDPARWREVVRRVGLENRVPGDSGPTAPPATTPAAAPSTTLGAASPP